MDGIGTIGSKLWEFYRDIEIIQGLRRDSLWRGLDRVI